jgi:hypothetical protein
MSILNDKKIRRRGDTISPAVKYVTNERSVTDVKCNTPKESKAKLPATSNPTYAFTEYFNMHTMTKQVASEQWAIKTAQNMCEWAESEDALILGEYYAMLGISKPTFMELANKYEILKKAHAYAKSLIAIRREKGMITRKFDSGSISFTMPMYSDDWKEIVEWRSSLKASENKSGDTRVQYVVIPEIPKSDLVAEKKKEENEFQGELPQVGQVNKED